MNTLENNFFKPKSSLILGLAALFAVITPLWHHRCTLLNDCSAWTVTPALFGGYLVTLFLGTAFFYTIAFFLMLLLVNKKWSNKNLFILSVLTIWIVGSVLLRLGLPYVNSDLSQSLNIIQVLSIEDFYRSNFQKIKIGMTKNEVIAAIGDPNEIREKTREISRKYQFNGNSTGSAFDTRHSVIGANGEFKKIVVFKSDIANMYNDLGNLQIDVNLLAKNEYLSKGEIMESVFMRALGEGKIKLMTIGLPINFFGKDFYFNTYKPFFKNNPNKVIDFDSCEYYLGKLLCYKNNKVALKANALLGEIKTHNEKSGANYGDDQTRAYYLFLEPVGPGPVIDANLFKGE